MLLNHNLFERITKGVQKILLLNLFWVVKNCTQLHFKMGFRIECKCDIGKDEVEFVSF